MRRLFETKRVFTREGYLDIVKIDDNGLVEKHIVPEGKRIPIEIAGQVFGRENCMKRVDRILNR